MRLSHLLQTALTLSLGPLGAGSAHARLLTIPTTPFEKSGEESYPLSQLASIVVDSSHADAVDKDGQTLIPPTLQEFAELFQTDLNSALGLDVSLSTASEAGEDSVFLTLENNTDFKDAAGRFTSEGYSLRVDGKGVVIAGASPLGVWWGTRSLIQAAVLSEDNSIPLGEGIDAPGWGTRGAFVCSVFHFSNNGYYL